MTRRVVYGVSLWITMAATAMTIASIVLPHWVSWDSKTVAGQPIRYSYGLHKRCSSLTGACEDFPQYADCHDDRSFCSMWRSVGFLMTFTVILELAGLIAFAVIILGGKQKRDYGWKLICGLLTLSAATQAASMAIVAYLFDHDSRFFVGWRLDTSWILCTVSWVLLFLCDLGLALFAIYLPEEGGYELIPNAGQA
ncbi:hypothetical protein BDY21DRAFT_341196 [Lineolata rhizophorae]|uniref:Uncharacterized protein n=1 Tax=Lineolata rhizophorae TaxID=578093 RepID=A0A6A6P3Y1_9PEZI|nr:hypothetical protein BDY21DRAFT_341196 [Lineolata rhizophorae]